MNTTLSSYNSNSIVSSFVSSSTVTVFADQVKTPSLSWNCRSKGKAWICENGVVIENCSNFWHGKHTRLFMAFLSQSDFDAGKPFCDAESLGALKLIVESKLND